MFDQFVKKFFIPQSLTSETLRSTRFVGKSEIRATADSFLG